MEHHLPDEAEELLKKRFQIINVSDCALMMFTNLSDVETGLEADQADL